MTVRTEVLNDFREGHRFFEVGNYDVAIEFFSEVCHSVGRDDEHNSRFQSWLGLAQALKGDEGGVVLCRLAAKDEQWDGDVLLNLARAEEAFSNRTKALRAIERGLELAKKHEGLLALKHKLDRRRRPFIPFLSRDNVINRLVGRYTYRPKGKHA